MADHELPPGWHGKGAAPETEMVASPGAVAGAMKARATAAAAALIRAQMRSSYADLLGALPSRSMLTIALRLPGSPGGRLPEHVISNEDCYDEPNSAIEDAFDEGNLIVPDGSD